MKTVDEIVMAGTAEYLARQADFPKYVEAKSPVELSDEEVLAVELLRVQGDDLIRRLFEWNHFGDGREFMLRINRIVEAIHAGDPHWANPPEGQR